MKRKRLRTTGAPGGPSEKWGEMPWRSVDVSTMDLGEFEDTVFFGLEELDGNAYKLTRGEGSYKVEARMSGAGEDEELSSGVAETASITKKAKTSKKDKKKDPPEASGRRLPVDVPLRTYEDDSWGGVKLHGLLVQSMLKLNFHTPTPIQSASIPMTIMGGCDVVGAAETGSGKTLAFCLPVLDSLLRDWAHCASLQSPYALIISPTRELTMQISTVLREVCLELRQAQYKVEVVSIVGGMSEHKQRRQLSGEGKPVHIVVATPGRLCELMQDENIRAFQDMSRLRYLVVDEADRIVEEGHFPELHRVFSRIRDHEIIALKGQTPQEVYAKRMIGTFDPDFASGHKNDDANGGDIGSGEALKRKGPKNSQKKEKQKRLAFDKMPTAKEMEEYRRKAIELGKSSLTTDDLGIDSENENDDEEEGFDDGGDLEGLEEIKFEPMPTEEQIAEARRNTPAIPLDELLDYEKGAQDESDGEDGHPEGTRVELFRQTLLFSATALRTQLQADQHRGNSKRQKKVKGLVGERVRELPYHMQQLLATVAFEERRNVRVVDVTGVGVASAAATGSSKKAASSTDSVATSTTAVSLPKGLSQQQVLVPTEDKDMMAYHFLLKQGGRTLVFVNSIKTARRLDGLLRALGLNSRTIHAQLQQKQRLKALETFRAAPVGILVATDIAARGLDIPKISTVVHYDVARSPQVYVHRSGRTARANSQGMSLSLVAPEDLSHHEGICTLLGVRALPTFSPDLAEVGLLRERVALAKKIFTQSFVASQKVKEGAWLEQSAAEAGLELDDYMIEEEGSSERRQNQTKTSKKQLEKARGQLKKMLDTPVALATQGIGARNRGFVVFAK